MKGTANRHRLKILKLLKTGEYGSEIELAANLHLHFETTWEHLRRLVDAGLVFKQRQSINMRHHLTHRGKVVLAFLEKLK